MSNYFCGWYFKCQSEDQTLSVIPAFHETNGCKSCSIQIITEDGVWNIPYSHNRFQYKKRPLQICVAGNLFRKDKIKLSIHTDDLTVSGSVTFGDFSPIRYDIMGPFKYVPFMECRHSLFSMAHTINGLLTVNGTEYAFTDGQGYMEGDRGRSFPREYAWTQCFFEDGSLMLSVARIPMGRFCFTGIIGVIRLLGKEYRLATYLDAKLIKVQNRTLIIRQGRFRFTAKLLTQKSHPLYAPTNGAMDRTIRENLSCRAAYRFVQDGKALFSFQTDRASFEYEYPD